MEQIQYVNDQAEIVCSLLDKMPVGVVKIDQTSGNVEGSIPMLSCFTTNEDGDFDTHLLQMMQNTIRRFWSLHDNW